MEVGRSASTGAGEIWMQVEDTLIAQNMHEAILSSMKSVKASSEQASQPFRPRSRSNVDKARPVNRSSSMSHHQVESVPYRSRTMSESTKTSPLSMRNKQSQKVSESPRPVSVFVRSSPSPSARIQSQIIDSWATYDAHYGHRLRSDSTESRGTSSSMSVEDTDSSPAGSHHGSHYGLNVRSITPELKTGEEHSDYLSMTCTSGSASMSSSHSSLDKQGRGDDYVDMSCGHRDNRQEGVYMCMNPQSVKYQQPLLEDSGYLDMAPIGPSLPPVQEKSGMETYLDMSAGHNPSPSRSPNLIKPDRVVSYLTDDTESNEEFPKRAYSVGSKPEMKSKLGNNPYLQSVAKDGPLDKSDQKSSSAPHLVTEYRHQSHRVSQYSVYDDDELFMEMTFDRPRTASESYGQRARTGSWGQSQRPRSLSHSSSRLRRPSTDSSRNSSRTSSCELYKGSKPGNLEKPTSRESVMKENDTRRCSLPGDSQSGISDYVVMPSQSEKKGIKFRKEVRGYLAKQARQRLGTSSDKQAILPEGKRYAPHRSMSVDSGDLSGYSRGPQLHHPTPVKKPLSTMKESPLAVDIIDTYVISSPCDNNRSTSPVTADMMDKVNSPLGKGIPPALPPNPPSTHSDYLDMTCGKPTTNTPNKPLPSLERVSCQISPSSSHPEAELNYASVEVSGSVTEVKITPPCHPAQYADIDFQKFEDLKRESNLLGTNVDK